MLLVSEFSTLSQSPLFVQRYLNRIKAYLVDVSVPLPELNPLNTIVRYEIEIDNEGSYQQLVNDGYRTTD